MLKTYFFAAVAIFALLPAARADFSCTIAQVRDGGDFENIHDFKFREYPNIIYVEKSEEGKGALIGALTFSEKDPFQPSKIEATFARNELTIEVTPEESGTTFTVSVNIDAARGLLSYTERGETTVVATLNCLK